MSEETTTPEFRLHKRRQRQRNQERKQTALENLLDRVPQSSSVKSLYQPIPCLPCSSDFWSRVPKICNPHATKLQRDKYQQGKYLRKLQHKLKGGEINTQEQEELWKKHGRSCSSSSTNDGAVTLLSEDRGQRKAWQVENFVSLLSDKLTPHDNHNKPLTVVDFGCGSGNLLALASYFTHVRFVLVDKKPYPLKLVQRRAEEAGLFNVEVMQYSFSPENLDKFQTPDRGENTTPKAEEDDEESHRSFDLGIGLHCCGSFTDMVMELCRINKADCIVCPCCNGAMTSKTTCGYAYPRSQFLKDYLTQDEYLGQLSKSADDLGNYSAKCLIEYDRALWAEENGFRSVELWKLTPLECTPKHHVLYLKHGS
jgi:SAM-dependent methyltransferase